MTPEQQALLKYAWPRGYAWRLLADVGLQGPGQVGWLDAFDKAPPGSSSAWKVSRQRGKSYAALLYAASVCAGRPGTIVRYAALTGKSALAIVAPTMTQVLEHAPADCRPVPKGEKGLYEWPNGSVLVWAGTDAEQFERLRGPRSHLILLDESAFYADLERVEAALLPQLQTTGGRALYLSSPPETPAHPFEARYKAAKAVGRAQHWNIHDNPRLGPEGVLRVARGEAERLGLTLEQLLESTFWRREYLAETVTESSRAVVPAWTEALHAELVVDWPRPKYFDGVSGDDWGIRPDPKGTVLGWVTPDQGLYVEHELEARDCSISDWVRQAKELETAVWGVNKWEGKLLGAPEWLKQLDEVPPFLRRALESGAPRQPYLRVGDDDSEVLTELAVTHGYIVLPTRKHDKHLRVNRLNELFAAKRIHIHPRCVRLIEQLYTTLWNRTRTDWERTAKDHGDLVAALVMLVNNIDWNRKVAPDFPNHDLPTIPDDSPKGGWADAFKRR